MTATERQKQPRSSAPKTKKAGQAEHALASALRVLRLEAEAILEIADSLSGPFSNAIDLLYKVEGRITLSGKISLNCDIYLVFYLLSIF